jgi:hypothetical protein
VTAPNGVGRTYNLPAAASRLGQHATEHRPQKVRADQQAERIICAGQRRFLGLDAQRPVSPSAVVPALSRARSPPAPLGRGRTDDQ